MEEQDKIIKCQGCGREFVFTVNDQKFYKQKNFIEPKRCKSCRTIRAYKLGN